MNDIESYIYHVTSFKEVAWGITLIAITMTIHSIGMLITLTAGNAMQKRLLTTDNLFANIRVLVLASWVIVLVHLTEVMIWAGFFVWRGAMPSMSAAYYYSLLQYVTVGSELTLPVSWRLLGGMVGMAGLLTFAWSTTVLLTLVRRFEYKQLLLITQRYRKEPVTKGGRDGDADNRV